MLNVKRHASSGYSIPKRFVHGKTEDKLDFYSGPNCIKNIFKALKDHGMKIIK